MQLDRRAPLAVPRSRRLGEARVEIVARRRGHQAERVFVVRLLDDGEMVRQSGHPRGVPPYRGPVRAEAEPAVRMAETVQETHTFGRLGAVDPAPVRRRVGIAQPRRLERRVDHLPFRHAEAAMVGAEALRQAAQDLVVRPALARRLDDPARDLEVCVAAGDIDVVVLQERGRRQDDVGHGGGLGHELLVDADEQVVAQEAFAHLGRFRRHHHRVGVLDEHPLDRTAVGPVERIAGQDRADPRLVEHTGGPVHRVQPPDQGEIDRKDVGVRIERPAAMVAPLAGDGRDAGHGVHVGRAVARTREPVADPHIGALGPSVERGEGLDLLGRKARDPGGPAGSARLQVSLQLGWAVGVFLHELPVGVAVAEQNVHDRAGERAVGAGPERQMDVRLLGRTRAVGVDDDQPGVPVPARTRDMGHHVDLGVHRIAAPDDDQVGVLHLARIRAVFDADPGAPSGIRQRDAERGMLARVAHGVAQPVDAVALHEPHRTGVEIGPDRLAAPFVGHGLEPVRDLVQRLVPADRGERPDPRSFRTGAAQRARQPGRMVHALGIAGNLGADHARRVGVALRAVHPADGARVQPFDVQRAGARAVVRTGRRNDLGRGIERHRSGLPAAAWDSETRTGRAGRQHERRGGCQRKAGRATCRRNGPDRRRGFSCSSKARLPSLPAPPRGSAKASRGAMPRKARASSSPISTTRRGAGSRTRSAAPMSTPMSPTATTCGRWCGRRSMPTGGSTRWSTMPASRM